MPSYDATPRDTDINNNATVYRKEDVFFEVTFQSQWRLIILERRRGKKVSIKWKLVGVRLKVL